ncbi:MAG: aldo/keto reductase [Oscillospiraceae bacterium]|nr:aldo/keto reductase [Oscillospiraceae bacterium]
MKKLGFGLMRLPLTDPKDQRSIDFEQLCKMVDTFLDRGFTYFDTAYVYHSGDSEKAVKRAIVDRHPRDSFTLATKLPMFMIDSYEKQEQIFNEQLEKCGVDYFDYYLLHAMSAENLKTAKKFDSFKFVLEKKAEGKIKKVGFSFHDTPEVLEEILTAFPEAEFVQLQINYLDWDSNNVQSRACYEVCVKHNKPVVVMEPVKGGTLAAVSDEIKGMFSELRPELSPAAWAIRYVASLENVMVVLSGMSNIQQLEDNTGYMQEFEPLTQPEYDAIAKAVDIIKASIAVPCTACRYCVDGCPMSIQIPDLFDIYNNYKLFGDAYNYEFNYNSTVAEGGKPSDCVACGQCEGICPQHIGIIDTLKDVAATFEK